eukprot:scaffold77750_cov21-Tisochrysis_lutea.AAC.2
MPWAGLWLHPGCAGGQPCGTWGGKHRGWWPRCRSLSLRARHEPRSPDARATRQCYSTVRECAGGVLAGRGRQQAGREAAAAVAAVAAA